MVGSTPGVVGSTPGVVGSTPEVVGSIPGVAALGVEIESILVLDVINASIERDGTRDGSGVEHVTCDSEPASRGKVTAMVISSTLRSALVALGVTTEEYEGGASSAAEGYSGGMGLGTRLGRTGSAGM